MYRLDKEDFVPYAPELPGESVVIAHQNCENGVDHKARLWIKRNEDNTIVAKCHNCQGKGYYRNTVVSHRSTLKTLKEKLNTTIEPKSKVPIDIDYDIHKIPVEFRAWLYKARLSDADIVNLRIGYSASNDRLIIPVYNREGELETLQCRGKKGNNPKYLNRNYSSNKFKRFYERRTTNTKTVILVEDILSAFRCANISGASVAILSSNISIETLNEIMKGYDEAVVFLDNDNPTVKKNQTLLAKNISMLTGKVPRIIKGNKDPKEYSDDELKKLLLI